MLLANLNFSFSKSCSLGMNWLAQHKAIVNTDLRTIKLSHGHEEVQLSIPVAVPVKLSGQVYEAIVQEI
jgi:hypothetical protein